MIQNLLLKKSSCRSTIVVTVISIEMNHEMFYNFQDEVF